MSVPPNPIYNLIPPIAWGAAATAPDLPRAWTTVYSSYIMTPFEKLEERASHEEESEWRRLSHPLYRM